MDKKNIKIKVIEHSNCDCETLTNVIGEISKNQRDLRYEEENVSVKIFINEEIVIKKTHSDYDLTLIFNENKKTSSLYKIKSPEINFNVEVDTIFLEKSKRGFIIKYNLTINKEYAGLFEIYLRWE
ncbi:MAG: DUF1934 family protein [Bacilli bacterium]|nr:DUF1934 family protein [Bacilli bacterium]MDD3305311.1 DUF1934 family protein [Bacilli bacterium]MDD4053315.1 DUF1934 family protein [Bacilli bacterium]MDD4411344.1 DUF1934 family protein [Bacilli bacterium]